MITFFETLGFFVPRFAQVGASFLEKTLIFLEIFFKVPSLARSVSKPLKVPSLARSVTKPLKVPSIARSVPKPLKVPSLARSVPKPLKVPSLARSVPKPLSIFAADLLLPWL